MDVSKCGVLATLDGWAKPRNGTLLWLVAFLMSLSCSIPFVKLFLFLGVVETGVTTERLNPCMGRMLGTLALNSLTVLLKPL